MAEAITNATRHAHASSMEIDARVNGSDLVVSIRDDGIGGADSSNGSGLVGLIDRVEALGGRLCLHSTPGAGTTLRAELPLSRARQARRPR